ncbi:MAG: hypothetical protein A4S09_04960 [Proteobacteria bacterium SG_bin7]|nr:MAG: hypothetical protein A4S09_04960 [Proteobacteria bacterium SG_bin7]
MKEFKTDNLALCPFLEMNGLKFLRTEVTVGKHDKPTVLFVFQDNLGQGRDLQLDFMRSEYKRYRDLLFFFRNEIEKVNRSLTQRRSSAIEDELRGEEENE